MKYSIFQTLSGLGLPCPTDLLMSTIDSQKLRDNVQAVRDAVAAGQKDNVDRLKKRLPAVTWQASFPDGKRCSEGAVPSGLYMLDIDDVADALAEGQRLVTTVQNGQLKDLVAAIHISPSGRGLRVVAVCADPALDTIEKNQAWLAAQLGLSSYDSACKDFARLAFLVPQDDFLLLNLDLLVQEPRVILDNPLYSLHSTPSQGGGESGGGNESAVSGASSNIHSLEGERGKLFTDEQRSFCFHGMLISDIAEKYLDCFGRPQEGERNTYYYTMCVNFRHITDCNVSVMLSQLPDFGLSVNERQKVVESATKRYRGGRIPYPFWKFLESLGLVQSERQRAEEQRKADELASIEAMDETPDDGSQLLPEMPMLFREYCNRVPVEFRWPMTAALLPILGTIATRLRALYDDEELQSPSFHSVIVGHQSSGKSIFSKVYYELTDDLAKRDQEAWAKERVYNEELKVKKNASKRPANPHVRLRLLDPSISVPKLLERQQDAGDIHQLSFTPEVDTLTNSNRGGHGMNKNDMYRKAWDNDFHGQDYMMAETFSGRVQLYQNILATGTPEQVMNFYGNVENGLSSRVMFAHIEKRWFASKPKCKKLDAKAAARVDKILQRLNATCYGIDDDGNEIILPLKDITSKVAFMNKPITRWLNDRAVEAVADLDYAKDTFRCRAAVKAFRAAMIAVAIYDFKPTSRQQHIIRDWALWIADMDLKEHIDMYADKMENCVVPEKKTTVKGLLHFLPDKFTPAELKEKAEEAQKKTPLKRIVHLLNEAKLIEKSNGYLVKTDKGKRY